MSAMRHLCRTCAAFIAALALGSACGAPKELPPTAGGLARGDAARLSLLVTQTRAQYPELTAQSLKQGPQLNAGEGPQLADPALIGEGVGLRPGIQVGARETVELSLFLDKSDYHAGYARISISGAPEETWRVIAYDLRGEVTGDFELLYALADGESRVNYLAVLGGTYEQDGRRLLAYEGTLILPGRGVRIEGWDRIFKVDFGFKHPAEPLYLAGVERANTLMAETRRAVSALDALRKRIETGRAEMEALRQQMPPPEQAQARRQELAQREGQIAERESERDRLAAQAEQTLVKYWATRASVDADFAEFVASNAFRWRAPAQQQAWFDRWKRMELHHPGIDELQQALAAFLPERSKIDQARDKALAMINRLDNWSKNPSRAAAPSPR